MNNRKSRIEQAYDKLTMTPTEAAYHIRKHNFYHSRKEPHAFYITKALNMAVEALEKKTPSDDKLRIYASAICDAFEDLLDEHDITIPDDEREGNEDEARIYGFTYENLENKVVDILKKLVVSD